MRFYRLGSIGLGLVMTLAACGSDEDGNDSQGSADSGTTAADASTTADASVNPGVQLKVNSFTANPAEVLAGRKSMLSWSVQGPTGTAVTIKQGSTTLVDASTALTASIETAAIAGAVGDKTTFTLTASAGSDSATATTVVSVRAVNASALPTINSFAGTQDASVTVFFGMLFLGDINVTWDVSNATSIVITDAAGAEVATGTDATGTAEVDLPTNVYRETVTLTATNDEGSVTAEAEVGTVAYVFSAYSDPAFVTADDSPVNLLWNVIGDVSLMQHDPTAADHSGDSAVDVPAGAPPVSVTVSQATDYILTTTQFDSTVSSTISVGRGVTDDDAQTGAADANPTQIAGSVEASGTDAFTYTLVGGDYISALVTNSAVTECVGTVRIYRGTVAEANLVGQQGNYACSWNFDDATAGEYIVVVSPPAGATADTNYALQVGILNAACGDGYVTANSSDHEQCDDENTTSGDGCSDTCQIEILNAADPLEVAATGQVEDTVANQTVEVGQLAYYDVQVAADRAVTISTQDADGSCIDMRLGVLAPNLSVYETADTDDDGNCPAITTALGGADFGGDNAGAYIAALLSREEGVAVENVTITTTPLDIAFPAINSSGATNGAEVALGSTLTTRDDLPGIALLTLTEPTSVKVQALNTTDSSTVACDADTTPALAIQSRAQYSDLTTFAEAPVSGVISAVGTTTAACPVLDPASNSDLAALPAGRYMVAFFNHNGNFEGETINARSADLQFTFNTVECGNGILENREGTTATEACDDGNMVDDDLCKNDCTWGGQTENEDSTAGNNNLSTDNEIHVPGLPVRGELTSGDVDYFYFELADALTLRFQTGGLTTDTCLGDTVMGIYDSQGNQVAFNDDSENAPGYCSYIEYDAAPGRYVVGVQGYNAAGIGTYFLHVNN